ncbi:protein AE7-like 1 isoform X1 [Henckelia pumila]|uniref:protein AE7-like 1 isoform X1 n=1 Tax=Henckelia pumila TaxID=405737 RepID=UPI003C6E5A3D
MTLGLINANPVVHAKKERHARTDDDDFLAVDPLEIYEHVRDIRDPEHPYSLEQLSVLSEESVTVDEKLGRILITFTPTIQHCSMATVIGLCLREKLKDCFPPHFKVDIKVAPGSHANEESVCKYMRQAEVRIGLEILYSLLLDGLSWSFLQFQPYKPLTTRKDDKWEKKKIGIRNLNLKY